LLEGRERPRNADESLDIGEALATKGRYIEAIPFIAAGVDADEISKERRDPARYVAACCAVLAASQKPNDGQTNISESTRSQWRRQALTWLRADWNAKQQSFEQLPDGKSQLRALLTHWLDDPDLTSVRDTEALQTLSSEERAEWSAFWKQVRETLDRAQRDTPAEPK
jgi:hypothetical protein